MKDLQQILFEQFKDKKLAHFYILKTAQTVENSSEFLNDWVFQFVSRCFANEKSSFQNQYQRIKNGNHPDLYFWTSQSKDNSDYSTEQGLEFLKFLQLRNFETEHKFAIIANSSLLKESLVNKLLKSLEEPSVSTTIFLLNPDNTSLLATLKSRGIELFIPCDNKKQFRSIYDNFEKFFESKAITKTWPKKFSKNLLAYFKHDAGISDVIDDIKTHKNIHRSLHSFLSEWALSQNDIQYSQLDATLEALQWFETSKSFNNASSERFFRLLEAVRPSAT